MDAAFQWSFYPLGMCQILALLEIVHPLTGLVKTGVAAPIMQVWTNDFVVYVGGNVPPSPNCIFPHKNDLESLCRDFFMLVL